MGTNSLTCKINKTKVNLKIAKYRKKQGLSLIK